MDLIKEKLSESIINIGHDLSSHIQRSHGCLTEGNLASINLHHTVALGGLSALLPE